jgi:hypothetical protein
LCFGESFGRRIISLALIPLRAARCVPRRAVG